MKKLLTIAAIAAATTALAVESSNTFGILRVDSSAAQTIVSVPWVAAGGGDINVADVVKTANLSEGDTLYYYNGTGYTMWTLTDGAWDRAQNENGEKPAQPISRGGAIILVRKNPSQSFYLYGQYTDAAATMNVAIGNPSTPAYSLVAPAAVNDQGTSLDDFANQYVGKSDIVMVRNNGVMDTLVCRQYNGNYKWGTERKVGGLGGSTEFTPVSVTIPAGEGFWYISRGGTFNAPVQQ